MPVFNRNRHSGSSGGVAAAYVIEQSCRFNDDDSPGLTWTPGSAADSNKIFTFSVWTKSGNFTGYEKNILTAGSSEQFYYGENSDEEPVAQLIAGGTITADRSMRDPSAWNHMVLRMDTTDGTAGDRFRMYQNGVEITAFRVDTNPSLNATFTINASGTEQRIGRRSDSNRYFDGYIAEVIMLDGVSAGPDSFGESDSAGNWVPIDPSSLTFGANGYWLDFAVAPGTSNGAGTDVSGEGNHFSESGLAANDKVPDSPTDDADNDVGNYSMFNPLNNGGHGGGLTISDGNLTSTHGAGGYAHCGVTIPIPTTGKWGFKCTHVTHSGAFDGQFTIAYDVNGQHESTTDTADVDGYHTAVHVNAYAGQVKYKFDGATAVAHHSPSAVMADGDYFELLVDRDTGTVDIKKNGSAYGSQITSLPDDHPLWPSHSGSNVTFTFDFGQLGYAPSDSSYKTLCTANLPNTIRH